MTAPTPEQLRALAVQAGYYVDWAELNASEEDHADLAQFRDALGKAADQIESVEAQRDKWATQIAAIERVADLAQDDEGGDGWVPIDPLLDALYPEKRGVSISAAADEMERLRAVIENAPHAVDCDYYVTRSAYNPLHCSCWKADAL